MQSIDEDVARLRQFIDELETEDARLPPEPKLCAQLGVSRSRLRTMLKRVEDEGLIWRHVGKGTFVGPRALTVDDTAWAASISVDDLFDARLLVEPQLAAQAALHATPIDIAAMEHCLAEMAHATAFLQWKRLDDKLHRAIAEATHNALLLMLYDTVRAQVRARLDARLEDVFGTAPSHPKRATDDEHFTLVDAIKAHNPARAEQSMRDHISSVRSSLFGMR
jgi:DNA-binding FadR family transcriptional regulator